MIKKLGRGKEKKILHSYKPNLQNIKNCKLLLSKVESLFFFCCLVFSSFSGGCSGLMRSTVSSNVVGCLVHKVLGRIQNALSFVLSIRLDLVSVMLSTITAGSEIISGTLSNALFAVWSDSISSSVISIGNRFFCFFICSLLGIGFDGLGDAIREVLSSSWILGKKEKERKRNTVNVFFFLSQYIFELILILTVRHFG